MCPFPLFSSEIVGSDNKDLEVRSAYRRAVVGTEERGYSIGTQPLHV